QKTEKECAERKPGKNHEDEFHCRSPPARNTESTTSSKGFLTSTTKCGTPREAQNFSIARCRFAVSRESFFSTWGVIETSRESPVSISTSRRSPVRRPSKSRSSTS